MTPRPFDLSGRVALVTGAGSPTGIGFATAQLLGELGASVAVTSTTDRACARAEELEDRGVNAVGVVGDLTDEAQVAEVVAAVASSLGGIDVLVNNAGMVSVAGPGESGRITDMSLATWRAGIARNLDTAFLVSRAVLAGMQERGWGRIVNVTSVTGPVMAMRDEVAYAAAKSAMVGLARSIAVDFGRAGITSNAVAPGWIATGSQTDHEHDQGLLTPVGRSATPTEVASAVAWLCTPGAAN